MTQNISWIIFVIGGIALLVTTWLHRPKRVKWILLSQTFSSIFCILCGILNYTTLISQHFVPRTILLLKHFEILCGGIAIGSMLTLAISGALWRDQRSEALGSQEPQSPTNTVPDAQPTSTTPK